MSSINPTVAIDKLAVFIGVPSIVASGFGVSDRAPAELELIDVLCNAAAQLGKIRADERVAQHVADRLENVRTRSRSVRTQRDDRRELVARLVLQNLRRETDQRF